MDGMNVRDYKSWRWISVLVVTKTLVRKCRNVVQ